MRGEGGRQRGVTPVRENSEGAQPGRAFGQTNRIPYGPGRGLRGRRMAIPAAASASSPIPTEKASPKRA